VRLGDVQADVPLGRRRNHWCTVDGCSRSAYARALCSAHYRRLIETGELRAEQPVRVLVGRNKNHGYWRIPVPRDMRHLTNGKPSEFEHRLVVAQLLGRALTPDESVHHVNGDRLDNRPENLELWSRWQPRGQRVTDKVTWAVELLQRYAPEVLAADADQETGLSRLCSPDRI
jgi:hypothetical protein